MKKWMLLTIAVVLVAVAALAPAVFAQGPADGFGPGYGNAPMFNGPFGPGFVDEDGDGVCDHAGTGGHFGRSGRMMGRWSQQSLSN